MHARPRRSGAATLARLFIFAFVGLAAVPRAALAGMPTLTLTDVARMRVQTISFFLLLILCSAAVVMWLWNWLRRDFTRLPRLSYARSLGLVALWGAGFVLVLTMISGARELMTPGAWEKDGATYKLTKNGGKAPAPVTEEQRRARMLALKAALWTYAAAHGGALPATDDDDSLPADAWETPDATRARYVYIPGAKAGVGARAVAYEPTALGLKRFALTSDGSVQHLGDAELETLLAVTDPEARR